MTSSRNRTLAALNWELSRNEIIPRNLWKLPWADQKFPGEYDKLISKYPDDITKAPEILKTPVSCREGNPFDVGISIDSWGCNFRNTHRGIQGEVKTPLVNDWNDTSAVHFPVEMLTLDILQVDTFCRNTQTFVRSPLCANPFERIQYIRGTENVLMDLALEESGLMDFLYRIHELNLKICDVWSQTKVDALFIMDDWGTQQSMLINPQMWRKIFKPLYREYAVIAHNAGKKIFMHSDGNILDIYPDLIEIGIDALNSQIFCIGVKNLAQFKGQITFWGEMDRQHILPDGTPEEIRSAVHLVYETLNSSGGLIAQCEFGPGANPENIKILFDAWNQMTNC